MGQICRVGEMCCVVCDRDVIRGRISVWVDRRRSAFQSVRLVVTVKWKYKGDNARTTHAKTAYTDYTTYEYMYKHFNRTYAKWCGMCW